jgi:hypothetical protein
LELLEFLDEGGRCFNFYADPFLGVGFADQAAVGMQLRQVIDILMVEEKPRPNERVLLQQLIDSL